MENRLAFTDFFDKKNSHLLLKNDGLGNPTWFFSYWGVFISIINRLRKKGGRQICNRKNLPKKILIAIAIVIILFYLKQILTTTRNSFNHFSNQEKIFVTVQFLGCHWFAAGAWEGDPGGGGGRPGDQEGEEGQQERMKDLIPSRPVCPQALLLGWNKT